MCDSLIPKPKPYTTLPLYFILTFIAHFPFHFNLLLHAKEQVRSGCEPEGEVTGV